MLAQPSLRLSPSQKGAKTVCSNFSVRGEGMALANAALLQTRSYFEVKVVEAGSFCVGVACKGW